MDMPVSKICQRLSFNAECSVGMVSELSSYMGCAVHAIFRWHHTKLSMGCYSYFPLKVVKTCDLNPSRNFVLCSHPHGFGAFGARGAFAGDRAAFKAEFPQLTPRLLIHRVFFYIPICREFALASGYLSASKSSLEFMMRSFVIWLTLSIKPFG